MVARWVSRVALAAVLPAAALVAAAVLVASSVPGTARAQDGADDEARGLFLAGQAAFEAARYEDALGYFRRAYERSARAELLYNVAIAADRLRRDEEALEAFERFLAGAPGDLPQRRDVEARVEVLRAAIAARAATSEGDAAAPEPEPEPEPAPALAASPDAAAIGGWSLVAGGAAVAIAGAVLLGVGRAEAARVEGAAPGTPWPDVAGSAASAEWMSPTGIALLALGAAAAAGGALWLALDPRDERPSLRVGLAPGGLAISGEL